MTTNQAIVAVTAITAVTILGVCAMTFGIDGMVVTAAIASAAGLGGYVLAKKQSS